MNVKIFNLNLILLIATVLFSNLAISQPILPDSLPVRHNTECLIQTESFKSKINYVFDGFGGSEITHQLHGGFHLKAGITYSKSRTDYSVEAYYNNSKKIPITVEIGYNHNKIKFGAYYSFSILSHKNFTFDFGLGYKFGNPISYPYLKSGFKYMFDGESWGGLSYSFEKSFGNKSVSNHNISYILGRKPTKWILVDVPLKTGKWIKDNIEFDKSGFSMYRGFHFKFGVMNSDSEHEYIDNENNYLWDMYYFNPDFFPIGAEMGVNNNSVKFGAIHSLSFANYQNITLDLGLGYKWGFVEYIDKQTYYKLGVSLMLDMTYGGFSFAYERSQSLGNEFSFSYIVGAEASSIIGILILSLFGG